MTVHQKLSHGITPEHVILGAGTTFTATVSQCILIVTVLTNLFALYISYSLIHVTQYEKQTKILRIL
jgi:hypothetical protein